MGIDILDVSYRIEKVLSVKVSNDDWELLSKSNDVAVGDLYDLLLGRLGLQDVTRNDFRMNHEFWLRMQQQLYSVTYVPKEKIQLSAPLAELFPSETIRETWTALRDSSGYSIPELDYPAFVRNAGFLIAIVVVAMEQLHLWRAMGGWLWPLLGALALWMVVETYVKILKICSPLRNRLPAGMKTVKDLCRLVLAINYTTVCAESQMAVDVRTLTVWEQLVEVIQDTLGVDRERITFRSRLVRDLGAA